MLLDKVTCPIVLDAGSYKPNVEKFLEKASIVISSEQFRDAEGRNIFEMPYENITMRAMTRGEKGILVEEIVAQKCETEAKTETPFVMHIWKKNMLLSRPCDMQPELLRKV